MAKGPILAGRPAWAVAVPGLAPDHEWRLAVGAAQYRANADYLRVRNVTLDVYQRAAEYARKRGIIIADTKMEFGLDAAGELYIIDELLTPDSSRFWPVDQYQVGISPPSFDKQYVRDYLDTLDWDKTAPGPSIPATVIANTVEKYREASRRLIG